MIMRLLLVILMALGLFGCRSAADGVADGRAAAAAEPVVLTQEEIRLTWDLGAKDGRAAGATDAQAGLLPQIYYLPAVLTVCVFFGLASVHQRILLIRLGEGKTSEDTVSFFVPDYRYSPARRLVRQRKELEADKWAKRLEFDNLRALIDETYTQLGKLDEVVAARLLGMFDEMIRQTLKEK